MATNALLPEKAVVEFQVIYKEAYGIELNYQEALDKAIKLLQAFRNIYKPTRRKR